MNFQKKGDLTKAIQLNSWVLNKKLYLEKRSKRLISIYSLSIQI